MVVLSLTCVGLKVRCALITSGGGALPDDDVNMPDALHDLNELRLPGNDVRVQINGVPASRLQAGEMKLKTGPPPKAQAVSATIGVYAYYSTWSL